MNSNDISSINLRGSEWNKWDLHVHTPISAVQEYGGDTDDAWERFICALEGLDNDIKVLGINDYLVVDGYKKVLEYKKSGRLQNIQLLLPVVEFRLNSLAGSSTTNRINFHVIFADESRLGVRTIENQFIRAIQTGFKLRSDIDGGLSWDGVLSVESVKNLGKRF